jgi:hypothetical protein
MLRRQHAKPLLHSLFKIPYRDRRHRPNIPDDSTAVNASTQARHSTPHRVVSGFPSADSMIREFHPDNPELQGSWVGVRALARPLPFYQPEFGNKEDRKAGEV